MFPYREQSVSWMVPLLAGCFKKRRRCQESHTVTTRLQILPAVGARVGTGHPPHHGAIMTREIRVIVVVTPRIPIRSYDTPIGAPLFMPIRKRPGTSKPSHVEYQTRI